MKDRYQCQIRIDRKDLPPFGVGDLNDKANQVAIRKIKAIMLENGYEMYQLTRVKINGYNVTAKIKGALKSHWSGK